MIEMWRGHYPVPGRCNTAQSVEVAIHGSGCIRRLTFQISIGAPGIKLEDNPGARHRGTQCLPRC